MTRARKFLAILAVLSCSAIVLIVYRANQSVLTDAIDSVSGSVTSMSLCDLESNRIPTSCTQISSEEEIDLANEIRRAQMAPPPSHGIRKKEQFLKISQKAIGGEVATTCFAMVEYDGFELELFLLRLETDKNCTGTTFKYGAGSIRLVNVLRKKK